MSQIRVFMETVKTFNFPNTWQAIVFLQASLKTSFYINAFLPVRRTTLVFNGALTLVTVPADHLNNVNLKFKK